MPSSRSVDVLDRAQYPLDRQADILGANVVLNQRTPLRDDPHESPADGHVAERRGKIIANSVGPRPAADPLLSQQRARCVAFGQRGGIEGRVAGGLIRSR